MPTHETESGALDALLLSVLEGIDAGSPVDRERVLRENPEFAEELREFFDGERLIENLAGPVYATDEVKGAETVAFDGPREFAEADRQRETTPSSVGDSQAAARAASDDGVGETFGRYRILETLGEGAMGSVHLAEDTVLHRQVALKLPKFGDDDPELLERFLVEARAAANLRHPNICPVHDVGEEEGRYFITMAYIPGRPLSDYARTAKRQKLRQVVKVVRKLALALHAAHEAGVVHRDVKPANVMVDENGEPIVMDFGLARQTTNEEVRLTKSGAVMGTPAYMSPEQVEGRIDDVGPASDQFSLGAVLYEMMTGELPFPGQSMGLVMSRILNEEPAPANTLRPDVDPELEAICQRMLSKPANERYASLADVATALNDWLQHDKDRKSAGGDPSETAPFVHPGESGIDPEQEGTGRVTRIEQEDAEQEAPPSPKRKKRKRRPQPTPPPEPVVPPSSSKPPWVWIAGGLGGAVLLVLGLVFLLRTPYGTLKVTVDDPRLTVLVEGEDDPKITITDQKWNGRRKAGKHRLSVMLGETPLPLGKETTISLDGEQRKVKLDVSGVTLSGSEFEIARNGETAVTIALIERGVSGTGSNVPEPARPVTTEPSGEVPVFVAGGWAYGAPRMVPISYVEDIQADWNEHGPSTDRTETTLVFGGPLSELYVSERPNANSAWGKAKRVEGLELEGIAKWKPQLSQDGRTLVFAAGPRLNRSSHLCVSRRSDRGSAWSPAERVKGTEDHHLIGVTDGGNRIITGLPDRSGLVAVDWDGETKTWGEPTEWRSHGVSHWAKESHLTADENTIVCCIPRLSPIETWQLYVQDREPGTGIWRERVSLTPVVSNLHYMTRPFVADDGRTIYFGRNRYGRRTRGDIWAIRRWRVDEDAAARAVGDHALEFDGEDDRVEISTLPDSTSKQSTIEARVRVGTKGGVVFRHEDFIDHGIDNRKSVALEAGPSGITGTVFDEKGKGTAIRFSGELDPDRVYHVALCVDGGSLRLYLNGSPVGDLVSVAKPPGWSRQPAAIGGVVDAPEDGRERFLTGTLDELRVSTTARYTEPFEPAFRLRADKQTLALYHFDAGRGDTLVDSSGNGHHGKIVGAKWVRVDEEDADTPFSFPERLDDLAVGDWQPLATKPEDLVLETNFGATLKNGAVELAAPEGRVDGRVVFEKVRGKRIIVRADVERLVGHTAGLAFEGKRRDYNVHGAKNRNAFTLGYRVQEVKQEEQSFEPPAPATTSGSHNLALAVVDGHAAVYLDGRLVMHRDDCEDWAWTPMLSNFNWEGKEPAKAVYRNLRVMVLDGIDGTTSAGDEEADHALEFDGEDDLVSIPSLDYDGGPYTVEAWIRPAERHQRARIVYHGGKSTMGRISLFYGKAQHYRKSDKLYEMNWHALPEAERQAGRWQVFGKESHVAGTWDGRVGQLYVDGEPVDLEWATNVVGVPATLHTFIGGGGLDNHFAGTIDEVRISKVVRYDAAFEPSRRFEPDANTLALYHFDEGRGDTLVDASGNGHHGRIVGAKWVRAGDSGSKERVNLVPLPDGPPGEVRVVDRGTDKAERALFSPDGRWLLTVVRDPEAGAVCRLWSVDDAREVAVLPGWTHAVAWFPDGKRFVRTRLGQRLSVHSVDDPRTAVKEWKTPQEEVAVTLDVSPDGRRVAVGAWDQTVTVWDVASGELLNRPRVDVKRIDTVTFSPDGSRVLAYCPAQDDLNASLTVWDAESGKLLRKTTVYPEKGLGGAEYAAFSADGRCLLTNRWSGEGLRVTDVATGEVTSRWDVGAKPTARAISHRGGFALSGHEDGTVRLWSVGGHELLQSFDGHTDVVRHVGFSPDLRFAVSASQDGTTRIWRLPRLNEEPFGEVSQFAVDLLSRIDVEKHAVKGAWRRTEAGLVTPAEWTSRTRIPYEPPEEYAVDLDVVQPAGRQPGMVGVGLVVGGRQVLVALDAFPGLESPGRSGLQQIDGKPLLEGEVTRTGFVMTPGRSHAIRCRVTRGEKPGEYRVLVTVDGRSVVDWTGAASRLSNDERFEVGDPQSLFLTSGDAGVTITRLQLRDPSVQTSAADLIASGDWEWSEPENLGPAVNTAGREFTAAISDDERTLVVMKYGANGQGGWGDLWCSIRDSKDDPWPAPVNMASINTPRGNEVNPQLSADGTELIYNWNTAKYLVTREPGSTTWGNRQLALTARQPAGAYINLLPTTDRLAGVYALKMPNGKRDLFFVERRSLDDEWGEPVSLGPGVNSEDNEPVGSMSDDRRLVVFIRSAGQAPSADLWMSYRTSEDAPWSEARRLPISTDEYREAEVRLSPNGRVLAFTSDRPGGQGGLDVYVSRLVPKKLTGGDPALQQPRVTFTGHAGTVRDVAFTPDGKTLVTSSYDKTIRLWDLATGREVVALQDEDFVYSVDVSKDGRWLVSAGKTGACRLWDLGGRQHVRDLFDQSGLLYTAEFSPDGKFVGSGTSNGKTYVTALLDDDATRQVDLRSEGVRAVRFSPNGRRLLSIGYTGDVVLVDPVVGGAAKVLGAVDEARGTDLHWSSDDTAFTSSDDLVLREWDVEKPTSREVLRVEGPRFDGFVLLADGKHVAVVSTEGQVQVHELASGRIVRRLVGFTGMPMAVAVSPDGRTLAAACRDRTVRSWDVSEFAAESR